MTSHPHPASAADAARRFLAGALPDRPTRVQVSVLGADGMPVLCAVEAVLSEVLPQEAQQELVWLSGKLPPGVQRLTLQAFGAAGAVLAHCEHELAG